MSGLSIIRTHDVERIVVRRASAPGQGIPVGGVSGQILQKNTNANYDTVWTDPPSGGGAGISGATPPLQYNSLSQVVSIPVASQSQDGYLSSADKTKLDNAASSITQLQAVVDGSSF